MVTTPQIIGHGGTGRSRRRGTVGGYFHSQTRTRLKLVLSMLVGDDMRVRRHRQEVVSERRIWISVIVL